MLRTIGVSVGIMIAALSSAQTHPILPKALNVSVLRGRITLYDWLQHETTSTDDFVVKTLAPSVRYVRVIYKPEWGFDAPSSSGSTRLDRLAFVGRGPVWDFDVHAPETPEQVAACSAPITDHRYKAKSGTESIPRFVSAPGAVTHGVPSINSLPCFILARNGLKHDADQ